MKWWRGPYSTLDTGPLTGVCVALVLAAIPLLDRIAPWAVAVFLDKESLRARTHNKPMKA